MLGEKLGKYQILDEVGQGGMSVVYRAHDTVLDRCVAIKVLHPHLSRREESKKRFEREARAIAKLSHPNILQVFDFSEGDAKASYIVMEFLDGCTLRQFVERHPIEHPEVGALLGIHLCRALEHAHELGIIHRDIKPENVMITEGAVKLMDFGIAEIVDAQTMTATGTLLGSPAHMSPEMIEGHELDYRADLFSLGTVLYFITTGELPFTGRNAPLVLKAILEGDYLSAEMINPRIGRRLSRIIDRCMAHDPADRYPSVAALEQDLTAFLADSGIGDPDKEIEAFLLDPEGYQEAIGPRLIEALEARGLQSLTDNSITVALEYFNRVLAIEPGHARVLNHIRNIDRRRRNKVYLGAAAAFAACVLAVLGISALVGPGDQGADPAPTEADPNTALAAEAADGLSEAEAEKLGPELAGDVNARGNAIVEQMLERRRVRIAVTTASSYVFKARAAAPIEAPEDDTTSPTPDKRPLRVGRVPARQDPEDDATNASDAGDPEEEGDAVAAASSQGDGETDDRPTMITVQVSVYPPSSATQVSIEGRSYSLNDLKRGIEVPRDRLVHFNATNPLFKTLRGTWNFKSVPATTNAISRRVELSNLKDARIRVICVNDPRARVLLFNADSNAPIGQGSVGSWISIPILDPTTASRKVRYTVVPSSTRARTHKSSFVAYAGKGREFTVELR
ncbi:MAG: hypothetical protein CMH57_04370 [Myxococcales bacterium]|nr:hypothetical protein [Myxococcales bacterium]